jgi:hypothetical protein
MRAILIDVKSKEVKYVELNKKQGSYLDSIYKLIDCEMIEGVGIDAKHTLYVDEDGIFNIKDKPDLFLFDGYPQYLVGNGLIIAYDKNGDNIPIELSLEQIAEKVLFTDLQTLQSIQNNAK